MKSKIQAITTLAEHMLAGDPSWTRLMRTLILILALMVCSLHAFGQSTAALNGTVMDPSKAMIAGATVTLRNVETGVETVEQTNNDGIYTFVNVLPGHYTVQASATGFETQVQSAFALEVNQSATVNFGLRVGAQTTQVNVSGSAVELESSTAELGTVVDTEEVRSLPLNGRNFTELLLLTPGTSSVNPLQNSGGPPEAIGAVVMPALNGQSNRSNMFWLDGVSNYGSSNDSYALQPTVDDILEFKVQSHNDDAQFGQVNGGIVNIATKSGTNSLHGTAWEFVRNGDFDAASYFAQQSELTQNQFGAAAGGPVVVPRYNGRDRTFFYGSYEGFRKSAPSSSLYITPTPAQLGGDFSATYPTQTLYNPYSDHAVTTKGVVSYVNNPFYCDTSGNPLPVASNGTQATGVPCNKIPSSLIVPQLVYYAKTLFPAPATTGSPQYNGVDNDAGTTVSNQMSVRIDETVTKSDRAFVRYTANWQPDLSPNGFQGTTVTTDSQGYDLGVNWVHAFGPRAVLTGVFGRVSESNSSVPNFPKAPADFIGSLGFTPNLSTHIVDGKSSPLFTSADISGYLNASNFVSSELVADIWEYKLDTAITVRRHLLKFGFSFDTDNQIQPFYGSTETFSTNQTSTGTASVGGDGFASFLLGIPSYGELDNVVAVLRGGKIYGMYVSDQWKFNNRLTINLGLRYDITDWPREGNRYDGTDVTGNMDLNNGTYVLQVPAPACSATQSAPCIPGGTLPADVTVSTAGKLIGNTYDNIQPRVGLAYRIDSKTAFRAAYGRFFDNWAAVVGFGSNFTESWPNVAYLATPSTLNSAGTPIVTYQDPLGIGTGAIIPAATPFTQNDGFLDPHLPNAYSDQYNAGFEREFHHGSLIDVNYVGAKNRREMMQMTGNAALTPGPGTPQSRAPYTYIMPQKGYVQSIGTSNYNALQVSSRGRIEAGITYHAAWTYSKLINFGCDEYASSCDVQDPYHWQNDKGVGGSNLGQIFAAGVLFDIPVGTGKLFSTGNHGLDYVLGGWQIDAISRLTSGTPFDYRASTSITNTGNSSGVERVNIVGNIYTGATHLAPYNKAAFASPPTYTFGNESRNMLRTDWYKGLDLSLERMFPIHEEKRFEVRLDAFNALNTPVFGKPQTTITNKAFNTVSSTASSARQLQVAAKFYF